MSRPDGDGGNVITCTHDGLAEHLWEPPRCPVAIPWAVRPAEPTVEGRLAELDALRARVARVEALRVKWETSDVRLSRRIAANELRRAMDGESRR